jgi:hypothetical protein
MCLATRTTEEEVIEESVDQFARLFSPIEDLPGVVFAEMELRAQELSACLGRSVYLSECARFELQFECLALPSDLELVEALAIYAVLFTDLLVFLAILVLAPPVVHPLALAWLVGCPWVLAAVAEKVLRWRATLAGEPLSIILRPDELVCTLGSAKARLCTLPFRNVLVREFRIPGRIQYALHLGGANFIVPVGGWMTRDRVFELARVVSHTLALPIAAEYADVVEDCVSGRTVFEFHSSAGLREASNA